MPVNRNRFAKGITEIEGKKRQVDIANTKEMMKAYNIQVLREADGNFAKASMILNDILNSYERDYKRWVKNQK